MNERDKTLLNRVQTDFPVSSRPFAEIGHDLDMDEDEVLTRLKELKRQNIIRRIGAVFESKKLGYKSCLVAAKVDGNDIERTAEYINKFPGVTHNYQRSHEYNLWFTLTASSQDVFDQIIDMIKNNTAIQDIRLLPAERIFQAQVTFHV